MADVTTIKVPRRIRDRLKAQATAAGLPLGEHLNRLADEADRRARFAALRDAASATTEPAASSYVEETEQWERAELSDADEG